MSYPPQTPPPVAPGQYPPYGEPAAPPKTTNGLSVAGLILAFLVAPIGFILSLIGLIQAGRRGQKGKGLAVAGLIVSLLIMGGTTAIIVAVASNTNITTVADPGCTSGKDILLNQPSLDANNLTKVKSDFQKMADGLNAAAAKANNSDVKAAMTAVADDYTQLVKGIDTGDMPADLMTKLETDLTKVDSLCTIGAK